MNMILLFNRGLPFLQHAAGISCTNAYLHLQQGGPRLVTSAVGSTAPWQAGQEGVSGWHVHITVHHKDVRTGVQAGQGAAEAEAEAVEGLLGGLAPHGMLSLL